MPEPAVASPDSGTDPLDLLEMFGASALTGLSTAVMVGVGLAVLGVFHPAVVAATALVASAVAIAVGMRTPRVGLTAPDVVILVGVVLWLIWSGFNASQHVFPTTDPGVYSATGWLLADGRGPGFEFAPGVVSESDGSYGLSGFFDDRGDGVLSPQFPRGLPVVLALAKSLGGAGAAFLAPVLISGLGLIFLYLLATRFIGKWWSVLAALALGLNLPFVHFGRGAYSEPLLLVLLIGSLWATIRGFDLRALGWVAGLALGAALCVRVDALAVAAAWPIAAAYATLSEGDRSLRGRRVLKRMVLPGVAGAFLALADVAFGSPSYWKSLRGEMLAAAALLGVSALLIVAAPRFRRPMRKVFHQRRGMATLVAILGVVAAVYVFAIRPFGPTAHTAEFRHEYAAEVMAREGFEPDPTRTMAESTGLWLWWYLGPVLIAGAAGAALMARRAVLRFEPGIALLLTAMTIPAAIYLWRPSINPLQLWASRRFLPVVMPIAGIVAMWAMRALAARTSRLMMRRLVAALAIAVAASPVVRVLPVPGTSEQAGAYALVREVCEVLPEHAVLFAEQSSQPLVWGVALGVVCDQPVVVTHASTLPGLMSDAANSGHEVLWFGVECTVVGEVLISTAAEMPALEQTVMRPPSRTISDFYGVTVVAPSSFDLECG